MPSLLLALQVLALPADGPASTHASAPLREVIASVCGPAQQVGPDELLRREAAIAWGRPTSADSLRGLACLRGVLAAEGVTGREGYLMSAGASWREGALAANGRLLERNPNDLEALRFLAAVLLDDPLAPEARGWAPQFADAVAAGASDRSVLRACVVLQLTLKRHAEARQCAERALRVGVDSTTHLLVVARERFLSGDTAEGAWAFRRAAESARAPAAMAEVTWHAAWFLSPEEKATWDTLPTPARPAWLADRLVARDIRDGRTRYARLAEHFVRLEHVLDAFALDAGALYRKRILTGLATSEGASQPLIEIEPVESDIGSALNYRAFRRWQVDFDDRGVVWMRFGRPDEQIRYTVPRAGDFRTFEAWKYRIDDETIVLSFESEEGDGSSEATRLVTGLWGEYFCGFDIYRCTLAARAQSAARLNALPGRRADAGRVGINTSQIGQLRASDQEQIVEATTKDDNSIRNTKHLATNAQFLRVWDPASGRPIALMPYAVKTGDLVTTEADGQRAVIFSVAARSWDPTRELWRDTTVVRRLRLPSRVADDARLTGLLVLPRTDGVSAWSLIASQDATHRGRAHGDTLGPLPSGPLALSDVILGAARQGQSWQSGTGPVILAPLGTFARREPVELYYQVRSDAARSGARTAVVLYRIREGARPDEPALEVGFATDLEAGITEVRRELDVSRLDAGAYRVEVRVTAGGVTVTQRSRLELR